MFENRKKSIRITVGDLELWMRPWADGQALITAREKGTNLWLHSMHVKYPKYFGILQDESDFCKADLDDCFSVIVDPKRVQLLVLPGNDAVGFRIVEPKQKDEEPDFEVIDHEDGDER